MLMEILDLAQLKNAFRSNIRYFSENREKYNYLMSNKNIIDKELEIGSNKQEK